MEERIKEVFALLDTYAQMGQNVTVRDAAAICGISVEALRAGIEKGSVPFAFESSPKGASRGYYVISPVALWQWYSGGMRGVGQDGR